MFQINLMLIKLLVMINYLLVLLNMYLKYIGTIKEKKH